MDLSLYTNGATIGFLELLLRDSYGIKIYNLRTAIKIICTWGNEIGYDLKPFIDMKEIIDEGYVYYQTTAKVRSKESIAFEFGEQYISCEEVTIVISGDAWGLHPEKERAYLALHESDDDMEFTEWNQDAAKEAIGEK